MMTCNLRVMMEEEMKARFDVMHAKLEEAQEILDNMDKIDEDDQQALKDALLKVVQLYKEFAEVYKEVDCLMPQKPKRP